MKWYCKQFNELNVQEFHDILKLRIDVFVVEQNCIYHELDDKDQYALHVYAKDDEKIVAYSRVFQPGIYHKNAAFGRVVVAKKYRGKGIGYEIIKQSLAAVKANFNTTKVWISAQTHLKELYQSFGFIQISDNYLDDGIPHIDMLKS